MKKQRTTTLYKDERRWFFAACSLVVVIVTLYMYFLSMSVVQVVMRKEINQEISMIQSHISGLEAEYIEAQHAVSADIASLHGYTRTDEKIFIDKTPTSLVLSFESNLQ